MHVFLYISVYIYIICIHMYYIQPCTWVYTLSIHTCVAYITLPIQTTASLLHAVMISEVMSTFYKINVHAALTPDQIWRHLKPAIDQAESLSCAYQQAEGKAASTHLPFVTVSVDNV